MDPLKILEKWYTPLYGIPDIAQLLIIEAMKEFATEVAIKTQENCANSLNIDLVEIDLNGVVSYDNLYEIILDKNNIPKL